MLRFPSLSDISDSLQGTLKRYFLCVIVAVVATVIAFILVDAEPQGDFPVALKILICCALAMPLFFSVHTLFEQSKAAQSTVLLGVGLFMIGFFYVSLPENNNNGINQTVPYRFVIWNIVLHLVAAFSAFYQYKDINGFWQWNKTLFLRFLLASLYSIVLYLGLAGAILAIDNLFSIDIIDKVYMRLWIVISLLFQPLLFLSGIPNPIQSLQNDESYPKSLRIFTQYVLLSLVAIYMLILYTYIAKILIEWNIPNGWVCYLVIGFSIAGILALLLLYPLSEKEEYAWIKKVYKAYYILILPLVILMFFSINIRIQDYGITPNRYIMLVLAFWLAGIAVYFTFFKQKNIIYIPISLAFMSFLSVIGPWSMFNVSLYSQYNRLIPTLTKNNMLVNGKLQKIATNDYQKISVYDLRTISSAFTYMNNWKSQQLIMPLIPNEWARDTFFRENGELITSKLEEKLGMSLNEYTYRTADTTDIKNQSKQIEINVNTINFQKEILDIKGFNHFAEIAFCPSKNDSSNYCYNEAYIIKGEIMNEKGTIFINQEKYDTLSVKPMIEKLKQWHEIESSYATYTEGKELLLQNPKNKWKIYPNFIRLYKKNQASPWQLIELRGYILYNK